MASTNPVHRALSALFPPSITIPPRLTSAADSLLAISRQRATHLKPDEEIARPHVCAEIACRKLRATLRLPNIKSGSGAPCRPAVYKKLLAFLEKTLEDVELIGTPKGRKTPGRGTPGTGRTTGTGTGMARKRDIEAVSADDEDVETPTKKRRGVDPLATPTRSTGRKSAFLGRIESSASKTKTAEAPDHVLPAIRRLCKMFETPKMAPHVYTGFCVLSALAMEDDEEQDSNSEQQQQHWLCLVIAVYLLTLTRMQEGPMTEEVYQAISEKSLLQVLQIGPEDQDPQKEIEDWISRINDEEWVSLSGKGQDWWSSVPEDILPALDLARIESQEEDPDADATPIARERKTDESQPRQSSRREELRKQLEESDPEDILLPGLGTMMNDAVDYFSEERNAEYEIWEAGVYRRLAAMEQGETPRKGKSRASTVSAAA
ncbi:hypothetical protein LTS08_002742 [Lithohypha guttulata]|uniref:ORC6 first cyclin-like domain-containing protein n=1 Tax=Lithohypha guttulata TaxID=1690604 RepID=A0AAN7T042_9EURO|nr:hypothetical protein LTR51_000602 [Lithohypha guttulata]KAK5085790.1 hypothetical protein LTR05_005078 [Lithohypha guttulata]KAK5103328.1 hypothetical protein LTS08_002742 [Lithohypha guttulata]